MKMMDSKIDMTASERIFDQISTLTDWRGETLSRFTQTDPRGCPGDH